MAGDWIGERNPEVKTNTYTPADVTLNRVKLHITDDGKFTLIDKSEPFEGRLDLTAKSQTLDIQYVIGMPVSRAGAAPSYRLTWEGDDALRVQAPGTDVVLHRNPKPSGG